MTKKNYLALFAKSFNWAGFFLPKNIYHDCSKLYAFCRVLDDLVDEKISLEIRTVRFNKIRPTKSDPKKIIKEFLFFINMI